MKKNTLECSLGWLSFISWFYHGKPVYSTFRYRATKDSLSYHVPFLSKLWARPQRHSHVCSCGHLPGNGGNFYNVPFNVNGDTQTWQRKIRWFLFGRHKCLLAVAWTPLLSNICQRRSLVSVWRLHLHGVHEASANIDLSPREGNQDSAKIGSSRYDLSLQVNFPFFWFLC